MKLEEQLKEIVARGKSESAQYQYKQLLALFTSHDKVLSSNRDTSIDSLIKEIKTDNTIPVHQERYAIKMIEQLKTRLREEEKKND